LLFKLLELLGVRALTAIGIGLNAMVITGGALNASDKGGNVADMINGTIGVSVIYEK